MISLQNISIFFDDKQVLDRFNLKVKKGEFVGVVGSNGSGKSTLAYLLSGVIPSLVEAKYEGSFKLKGEVNLILQNPASQFLGLTVKEEAGSYKELGNLVHKNVFQLSEGEKQRVNLVANLYSDGDIIILDEPLELLDPLQAKKFLNLINDHKNKTIVWFDKDERFLTKCDRIIHLDGESALKKINKIINKKQEKIEKNILEINKKLKINKKEIKIKLKINKNQKIAIIGVNGSGKTSVLKHIALNTKNIGYAPQNPAHLLFEDSVKDEIKDKKNIERLRLKKLLNQDPNTLSKGQQKLVSLAAVDGSILLLDEPTTWLDDANKALVYQFLQQDKTMIIATHDKELLDYVDAVYIIEDDELIKCSNTMIEQFFKG